MRSVFRSHDDSATADRFGCGPVRRSLLSNAAGSADAPAAAVSWVPAGVLCRAGLAADGRTRVDGSPGRRGQPESAAIQSIAFYSCSKPVGPASLVDRACGHGRAAGRPVRQSAAGRAGE